MRIRITLLVIMLATLAAANDLVKEKQATLAQMQRVQIAELRMIENWQRTILAAQDSIAKHQDFVKYRAGYMMSLADLIKELQPDTIKAKPDTTEKGKKDAK